MELCLAVLAVSLSNILCFLIGVKTGTNTGAKEPFKLPNPVEKVKEHKESKALSREQKQRQEALKTMLHNIDVYDGTDMGQQEVRL